MKLVTDAFIERLGDDTKKQIYQYAFLLALQYKGQTGSIYEIFRQCVTEVVVSMYNTYLLDILQFNPDRTPEDGGPDIDEASAYTPRYEYEGGGDDPEDPEDPSKVLDGIYYIDRDLVSGREIEVYTIDEGTKRVRYKGESAYPADGSYNLWIVDDGLSLSPEWILCYDITINFGKIIKARVIDQGNENQQNLTPDTSEETLVQETESQY